MDPISWWSLSLATYTVGRVCYRAHDTIRLGRKVESVLRAFLTEQTIFKEYRCYFSSYVHTSTLESNHVDLWSNACIRTSLEAEYGYEKAHSILATLWETEQNIEETHALLNLVSQTTNESGYSKPDETALVELRTYFASNGTTTFNQNAVLELLEVHIERIKTLNKTVSRLLSCPNQLKLSCKGAAASQIASRQIGPLPNTKSSLVSIPVPMHPISISEQLHALLRLNIEPETQEIQRTPASSSGSGSFPATQELVLPSYSKPLPPKLPWWKILSASPHRSFFIVQALLFILGIGVTIFWALWKGDLGTATGCGGLVFAIGSTANMVWDKCHSNPVTEVPFLLKES